MITLWPDKLPPTWSPPDELPSGVRLLVYQEEIAPATNRRHFQVCIRDYHNSARSLMHVQMYIAMTTPMKPTGLMKILKMDPKLHRNAWHVEARYGTEEQAIAYCVKDDTRAPGAVPVQLGTPTEQGRRNGA